MSGFGWGFLLKSWERASQPIDSGECCIFTLQGSVLEEIMTKGVKGQDGLSKIGTESHERQRHLQILHIV